MSFFFNEANRRLWLPAGLYGQSLDALALNLPNAAAATRLKLDLYVANSSFVATDDALMDITSIASLQAVTGLALHQGSGYASMNIATVTLPAAGDATMNAQNKVTLSCTPTTQSWLAIGAATSGYDLEALLVRYTNGAGIELPVFWLNGGDVPDKPMLGGDVNVSLPFLGAFRSLAAIN